MRFVWTVLFLGLAVLPAAAASTASAPDKPGAPGTNVEMPFLMAPLTGSDGKLSGYAYISTRLSATSAAGALEVRDKIAFIQDVFVRDVYGAGVAKPADPGTVDNAALEARLLADARKVMGPGKVASIAIVQLQIARLHPDSTQPPASMPPPGTPVPDDKPTKKTPATETAAK